ncbi:MAG TPA: M90 family metallopeptidase [Polyangiaceae bacterium]|jgi:hypothetical protein
MSRREKLRAEPFEAERVAIIERNFPYFARLSEDDKRELLGNVRVFLDEKKFEGCDGLELTDEIELTIAAQACLLLLHRETDVYPGLDVILVYPTAYKAKGARLVGGVVVEDDQVRLGESHRQGIVVLAWDAVKRGAADLHDGHNVVLHEFAHKLDEEDGAADGAPVLERRASYGPWARVLGAEFEALTKATDAGRELDIDSYGATSPAEFFAVVTEEFFEAPEKLARNHPRLYEQLVGFYKQDPLARLGIAFEPPPETFDEPAPGSGASVLSTLSNDPTDKVSAYRDALVAMGCKPCGLVATLHRASKLAFVTHAYTTPDPTVIAQTSWIRSDDSLSFRTLFDNGSSVESGTDTDRMRLYLPLNSPSEHAYVLHRTLDPARLYEKHRALVRRVAAREKATPLAREPYRMYLAMRVGDLDRMARRKRARSQAAIPAAFGIFVVTAIVTLALLPKLTPQMVGVACGVGVFVAMMLFDRVARLVTRLLPIGPRPGPPDALFARAARVDAKHEQELLAMLGS